MSALRLPAAERELLASVKGKSLDLFVDRPWEVEVRAGDVALWVMPEEAAIDDCQVLRLMVAEADSSRPLEPYDRVVASDRGVIVEVALFSTLMGVLRTEFAHPDDVDGDWPWVTLYRSPERAGAECGSDLMQPVGGSPLAEVDVAIALTTTDGGVVTAYTDSAAYFTHAADGLSAGRVPLRRARKTLL